MRKFFPAILVLIVFLVIPVKANAFYDVKQNDKYFPAAAFLEKSNIITGYPDGTFKPYNTITRAEFVKIIIRSAGLQLNIAGSTGFKDVDESSWYAPYARKAKTEGILAGYPDGTFRPSAEITKAEALKIIGAAQNWKTANPAENPFEDVSKNDWFAPYISFAKEKKLIDKSKFFQPDSGITRGLASDIIYKSDKNGIFKIAAVKEKIPAQTPDIFKPLTPPEIPQIANNGNVDFSMASKKFFDNITLVSDFPTHFYKNEVYEFEGSINSGSYKIMFIFLNYKDQTGNSKNLDFIGNVVNNQFSVPVVFRYPGTYEMGIVLGTQGTSKIQQIAVSNFAVQAPLSPIPIPSEINIDFLQNKTTISLDPPPNGATKITFSQGEKEISYVSRQQIKTFDVPYPDFYNFQPGETNLKIETAQSLSLFPLILSSNWNEKIISFNATRHLFNKIEIEKISVSGLPSLMKSPSKISISGISNTEILKKSTIIKPDGLTEDLTIESSTKPVLINSTEILPKGASYALSYTPKFNGTYIIGISDSTGAAIISAPIYIGNVIPLLPDFFDIKDMIKPDSDLSGASDKYLNWVNGSRQKLDLGSVKIDDKLAVLAQNHAEDMAKNNYFSHINLSGKSPNDRRIEMKIGTEVGENIARTQNLATGFEGFMRSPSHRKNILTAKWTKVGFGFGKNANNDILIVQEFSSNPLTSSDILKMETELLAYINKKRAEFNLSPLSQNETMTEIAKSWSVKMANANFTSFTSPDGSNLEKIIKENAVFGLIKMFVYSQNTTEFLNENIVRQSSLLENHISNIGLGIAVSALGDIKAAILLNE